MYFRDAHLGPLAARLRIFDALLSGLYHGWPDDSDFDAIELVINFIEMVASRTQTVVSSTVGQSGLVE